MKPPLASDPEFQAWREMPGDGGYARIDIWQRAGRVPLDRKLTRLAEMYLEADAARREQIRAYFADKIAALGEMWLYVRRVARCINSADDVEWLRRGLTVAVIEGGRIDYRDTIVSLVILRHAAERAGIDPRGYFDEAIKFADSATRPILRNARDHSHADVLYTVRAFGPRDWAAEVRRANPDEQDEE